MALKPYVYVDSNYEELTVSNPLKTTHDGKNGDTVVTKVFLQNDDPNVYYTDIVVSSTDTEGAYNYEDISFNETGWGVKLIAGDVEPSDSEWDDVSWGNSISLPDVGSAGSPDTSSYVPFWYLITCPPSTEAQNKKDIQLVVDYLEEVI